MAFITGYLAQGVGSAAGFQENTNTGYSRVLVTFGNLSGGQTTLATGVSFLNNVSVTVTQRALYDAPTGGNLIMWWMTSTPVTANASTPDSLAAGSLVHTFPALASNGPGAGATPLEYPPMTQIGTNMVGFPIYTGVAVEVAFGTMAAAPTARAFTTTTPTVARTTASDAAYAMPSTGWNTGINVIAFPALSAARAITLPSAASVAGKFFVVIDESGLAGTNNINLTGTVSGSTSQKVSTNYGVLRFYSNGSAYFNW